MRVYIYGHQRGSDHRCSCKTDFGGCAMPKKELFNSLNRGTSALLFNYYLSISAKEKPVHTQNSYTLSVWFKVSGVWPLTLSSGQTPCAARKSRQSFTHIFHTPTDPGTAHCVELAWQIVQLSLTKLCLFQHDTIYQKVWILVVAISYLLLIILIHILKNKDRHRERWSDVEIQRIYHQTKRSATGLLQMCMLLSHIHSRMVTCWKENSSDTGDKHNRVCSLVGGKKNSTCDSLLLSFYFTDSQPNWPKSNRVFSNHSLKT